MASDVLLAGAVCKQTSFLCSGVHVLSLAIGVLMARVTSSHHVVDSGMTIVFRQRIILPGCRF